MGGYDEPVPDEFVNKSNFHGARTNCGQTRLDPDCRPIIHTLFAMMSGRLIGSKSVQSPFSMVPSARSI